MPHKIPNEMLPVQLPEIKNGLLDILFINRTTSLEYELKKNSLTALERQLLILSYKKTLKRGFSVVRYEGKIITDEKYIKVNDSFEIEFYDNNLRAKKL